MLVINDKMIQTIMKLMIEGLSDCILNILNQRIHIGDAKNTMRKVRFQRWGN